MHGYGNGVASSKRDEADAVASPVAKRVRLSARDAVAAKAVPPPPPCEPLGNLLFKDVPRNARHPGLGRLAVLSDELLSTIFSELPPRDLVRIQAVSPAFYAFTRTEGNWKLEYIKRARGKLGAWQGSWRSTYVHQFLKPTPKPADGDDASSIPTDSIRIRDVYSDVLYLPYLAAKYDANAIASSSSFANNIARKDARTLHAQDLGDMPMILTHAMDDWAALASHNQRWTLPSIAERFPETEFRAEAVLTRMRDYAAYHDACPYDESPLYIFDADFVEKTAGRDGEEGHGLGADFQVPALFRDDLFKVLGDERPNYRWLIAGPERSGSTFHCDPNATSAWNAVVTGRKMWILFPKDIVPPGIMVSEDQSEVEAPLSLAEWLMNYYSTAKATYGSRGKDPSLRGKMLEGVCETGETFYVPQGWWHLVVNLESSLAVTQNFVSPSNLAAVLHFLKHRADQVSGFKLACADGVAPSSVEQQEGEYQGEEEDETGGGLVYARFCEALKREYPDILMEGLKGLARLEMEQDKDRPGNDGKKEGTLWTTLTQVRDSEDGSEVAPPAETFSFGFDIGDELDDM